MLEGVSHAVFQLQKHTDEDGGMQAERRGVREMLACMWGVNWRKSTLTVVSVYDTVYTPAVYAFTLPTSGSKIHAQASDLKCMMQEWIQIRAKSNNLLVSIEPCFHTWISSKMWSKIEFIWTLVWFIIAVFLTLAIMSILMMWECSKIQSEKKPSGVKSNSGQDYAIKPSVKTTKLNYTTLHSYSLCWFCYLLDSERSEEVSSVSADGGTDRWKVKMIRW